METIGCIVAVLFGLAFCLFVSVPVVWMMGRAVWGFWARVLA